MNNKILCFTTSYHRPYHLYNTISNILHQTCQKFDYVVGICVDNEEDIDGYKGLLSDHSIDRRFKYFFHPNLSQHDNYLYPIKQIDYTKYNLFIKIDDDDIYKPNYIECMINLYKKHNTDILSSNIRYQINNYKILDGHFDNVGGYWHEDLDSHIKFGMPFTYIFNKKCLDILLKTTTEDLSRIHPFEDAGWRRVWRDNNIKSIVLDNIDNAIYHIHGKNISSHKSLISNNDKKIFLETDNMIFIFCKHFCWESYIFCNKKDNRVYNVDNNDYGNFVIDKDTIFIKWDDYENPEQFRKQYLNNTYSYIFIK